MTPRPAPALMLVACLVIAAPARSQQPAFRSTVEAVEVDVAVTRGGKTVAGLTADNFVVTDNGVAQKVTGRCFRPNRFA